LPDSEDFFFGMAEGFIPHFARHFSRQLSPAFLFDQEMMAYDGTGRLELGLSCWMRSALWRTIERQESLFR
jgi:hypothetical protein